MTEINFNKFYKLFNIVSILFILASLLLLIFKGLNYGIDFKGGTLIELRSNNTNVNISEIRASLNSMNLGDVNVKEFGKKGDYLIKVEAKAGNNNQLIPEITNKVIQDEGLKSSASPRVEVLEILPVKMKLTVPLEPDVKIGDYSKIRVEQNKVKVPASEINERIEGLRNSLGSWEPVDDRNVQLKDMVTIDVIGSVESEKVVDQKNVTLVADEGQGVSFKGFATNLVGMAISSTKEFEIKLEDDFVCTLP